MIQTRLHLAGAVLFALLALPMSGAQPRLDLQSGVELRWPTGTGNTYRVQWSPASGGAWTDFGPATPGNGTTNSLYDPVPVDARDYRVLEIVPGAAPAAALPVNRSFELGSGASATNWSAAGTQPPVRTNSAANSGLFAMRCAVTNATGAANEGTLTQLSAAQGGTVFGGQTYAFSFWARQVSAGASYVQQLQVQWLNGVGTVVGGTGLANFSAMNGVWTKITVPGLVAPADAVEVRVKFRVATGAVVAGHGEVFIDDVELDSGGGTGGPGQTNVVAVATLPVAKISWPSSPGVPYQPELTTALEPGTWTNLLPLVMGDGGTKSILLPMARAEEFIRLQSPTFPLLPPTNFHAVASGSTNAIGLAWTASSTPGVIGYRIFYGVAGGDVTNSIVIGNLTTATVSGLTPELDYFLAVAARTADEESEPTAAIIAQTDADLGIVALFNASTLLEPETTIETPNALITRIADRARDRHAREGNFNAYDHYLTWYWEERTIAIEIVDRVAKGGTGITFNYQTLTPLGAPEFRAFFRGINTVAEYHGNYSAPLIGPNLYSQTLNTKLPGSQPLQIGDRVEIEVSQFIAAPVHGRNNYYGTAMLYIVGKSIVPWEGRGALLESFPLTNSAWLGGLTTLPYQYSNEPQDRFKQTAGNIAPTNAQPFMLGRRLHHTDFGNGAHSEAGNPAFTAQVGKLGPKYIARSCVACHVNNGRALPPAVGAAMLQSVVKVGGDANGAPHPALGSVLQPQSASGPVEGGVSIASYTTNAGQYGDGAAYALRKPEYAFTGVVPAYFSVRLAPPLVGLGLLEAVSESTILALADPDDADPDGISGRIQTVLDPETGEPRLGRFSSKAGKARVSHQIAAALNTDMGVTTGVFPLLDGETNAGSAEVSAGELDQTTRYVSLLGVSARRNLTNAQALQGEQLFASANCVKCHTPILTTSPFHPMTELRNQTIHPYTDLLLHDMGAGLADNLGEFGAAGSEWRTPPLWSIGLTAGVSGGEAYLHDGRARTLEEAILWHGGEAEGAKESFRTMPAAERAALIQFLKSL